MSKDVRDVRTMLPSRPSNWQCRVCKYHPNDGKTCINCGRDWYGFDGVAPSEDEKPFRTGLRGG